MQLKSDIYRITAEYSGKTKIEFWCKLKINDRIQFIYELVPIGHGPSGNTYSTLITIQNLTQNTQITDSVNILLKTYLSKIKMDLFQPLILQRD